MPQSALAERQGSAMAPSLPGPSADRLDDAPDASAIDQNGEHVITLNVAPSDTAETGAPDEGSDEEEDDNQDTLHLWDEDSDEEDQPKPKRKSILPFAHDGQPHLPNVANWWRTLLMGSAAPGTLSTGHVAMNLLSSGLHPGVLLAMPVYFTRAGVLPGLIVLIFVAMLTAFGGALWITLGRYVGGNTIESITGRAFGMNTQWKRNLGLGLSSVTLVVYCTGAAVIGYHGTSPPTYPAMTDLLLQVFFHYMSPGNLLHGRAFVTLFVIFLTQTLPLLISTTPKRNIIQLQSWTVVMCYPMIAAIMYMRMHDWHPEIHFWPYPHIDLGRPDHAVHPEVVPMPHMSEYTWPWASTAMLPLLLLSATPAQILAHARSLRRKAVYDSNVRSFYLAQLCQSVMMISIIYIVGVQIGMVGSSELDGGLHANFFSSLPLDDDLVNTARILFTVLLAAHLCVCLASARSSWSRLLNLLNVHPLRSVQPPTPQLRGGPMRRSTSATSASPSPRYLPTPWRTSGLVLPSLDEETTPEVRAWRRFKFVRGSLSALVLWSITALSAYFSGVGGVFRRNEKEGEELRFLRSLETIGIVGAFVGFLLPAFIWLVLFRIRRPRAILMLQSNSVRRRMSRYLLSPLSALIPTSRSHEETEPLMNNETTENQEEPSRTGGASYGATGDWEVDMPSHENEETSSTRDDATLILLARKERQLQRRTRGRRLYQELIVVAVLLPFGLFLVVSSAIELAEGGY